MGTPDFSVPTLSELIGQGHEIACVYTRAPRPAGRGQKERPSPVEAFARIAGLEVRTPQNFKAAEERAAFAALGLDAAIVVAYGLILPREVLEAPRLGCFNVHASLLPRWRGAAPIQRAIMAGDAETGISIMQMEEGLDTGPVLMSERVRIGPATTAGALHDELAALGASLMIRTLSALERGAIKAVPQPSEGVTYAKKIDKAEARIDWSKSAEELDRLIRALSPAPGAWFEAADVRGEPARIRVIAAKSINGAGAPGEILSLSPLIIACGEGALELSHLQRAGGAALAAPDFLRGFPLAKGARLV
jgi:methionyl-tRNA formyltransferase